MAATESLLLMISVQINPLFIKYQKVKKTKKTNKRDIFNLLNLSHH